MAPRLLQSAGMAALIRGSRLIYPGYSPIRNAAFRRAGNPAHEPGCLLAYADHSAVRLFLSLELFCHLESAIYFSAASYSTAGRLGPCSPSNVANAVPDRKYRRRTDVWPLCMFSICDCHPVD